jgi:hypothetical protein
MSPRSGELGLNKAQGVASGGGVLAGAAYRAELEADAARTRERLLADAAALERLSGHPEWLVLDRLLAEQIDRIGLALRQRGLDYPATEALRAELDALAWLRDRPRALRQAVEQARTVETARDAAIRAAGVREP